MLVFTTYACYGPFKSFQMGAEAISYAAESYFLAINGLGIDFQSSIPMVNTRRGG